MEEMSSPTDVSSSLSEFIRKERLLKELYNENRKFKNPFKVDLKYDDEEIDGILQQMGRLLSPAGESDNKVYKHVIEETENKSIEEILNEAKELISDTTPVGDKAFTCSSADDSSSECPENDFARSCIDSTDINGNRDDARSSEAGIQNRTKKNEVIAAEALKTGYTLRKKLFNYKKDASGTSRKIGSITKKKENVNKLQEEILRLRSEIARTNDLYRSCKNESNETKRELQRLEQQWQLREAQLLEENRKLTQTTASSISLQQFDELRVSLNNANETINNLKQSSTKAAKEWHKKEIKLIDECNQLRYKLQNTPKLASLDTEKLQEQLKDAQETVVKLKVDLDYYKDKCVTLENLCGDLKKIIVDEEIAERVYANDNIPASVKQFLSSSSSSVISTLSHMFGCLPRSASKNRTSYSSHKNTIGKSELFTTSESLMINDLSKSSDYNEIIKELLKEKETLKKQNLDLNRQVKELETIVRRRAHPNFSNVSEIIRSDESSKLIEKESEMIKNLKKELLAKQHVVIGLENQLVDTRTQYEQNLSALQGKIVSIQEESLKLRDELDRKKLVVGTQAVKCKRKGRSCDPPPVSTRNFRCELSVKDKEIQLLYKQIDELKKANHRLAKDKESYCLSSKEQSADNIRLNKKYISANDRARKCDNVSKKEADIRIATTQSEDNFDGLSITSVAKNADYELKNDISLLTGKRENQRHSNGESFEKAEVETIKMLKNNFTGGESPKNYEQLFEKINFLESRHQNLQKITCDLLKLLSAREVEDIQSHQPIEDESSTQHRDEFLRYVSALKSFSK